jgi:hypothetical protein
MNEFETGETAHLAFSGRAGLCPPWCTTPHGATAGEEDWLHVSEPVVLADEVLARLCMTVDPETNAEDGPYVVVGSREYSLPEAEALGASLIRLASLGGVPTRS